MYIEKIEIEEDLKKLKEANDEYSKVCKKVEEFEQELKEQLNKFKEDINYHEIHKNLYKIEKDIDNKKELFIYNIYNELCEVVNKKLISFNKLTDFLDDLDIYFDFADEDLYFEEDDEFYYLTYYCEINCREFEAFKISKGKINELIDILNKKLEEIYKKEG